MSDDLISRSEVLKLMKDIRTNQSSYKNYEPLLDISEKIRHMPTAYDLDKVVEQLETDEKHTFDGCINKRYAIKTVKAGGVNE